MTVVGVDADGPDPTSISSLPVMLRPIARPSTLCLLEQLTPSLVSRARSFSHPALNSKATGTKFTDINSTNELPARSPQGPPIDPTLRDQILATNQSRRFLPTSAAQQYKPILRRIADAVEAHNLPSALEHWETLEGHGKILRDPTAFRVSGSLIRDLHKLFVLRGLETFDRGRGEGLKTAARDFAMHAAKHHSAEALAVLMVYYIRENDPHTVLDLYGACVQALGSIGFGPPDVPSEGLNQDPTTLLNPGDTAFGLALEEQVVSQEPRDEGRISVLLAAIAAHAMLDSFKSAFEMYDSAAMFVSGARKRDFLRYLSFNIPLRQKAEKYIDRVSIASVVSRPISFSKHIMNLADPRTTPQLEGYYGRILDGLFGPEPYLAASPGLLSSSPNFLSALDESSWTALQTAFIKCERIDLAAKIWDDLAKADVKPGVTMWTGLLDSHATLRNSAQAIQTWDMMLEEGIQPDHLSYRAMIQALMDDGRTDEGIKKFKEYQETIDGRDNEGLSRPVYNTVLHGLLRTGLIAPASFLLEDMQKHGPKPDVFSYNTLLGYYARQKDFKSLSNTLTQMSDSKIPSDVVTFSTILSALLGVGRKDAPSTIMSLMRKQGIRPNVATYTAIIDAQMREGNEANLNAALSLLEKMEKEDGIKPNEVTYTAILSALYREEWISRSAADSIRARLVQRMRAQNITFSLSTYHVLMRAALDSADEEAYIDALKLLQEMERANIPRVGSTWYVLLAGLMRRAEWDVANQVADKMWNSGHKPSKSLQMMSKQIKAKSRTGRMLG